MSQAWFTRGQICQRLQVTDKELKTLRERHGLPFMAVAKGYRYPIEGVLDWETGRTIATVEPRKPREEVGMRRRGRGRGMNSLRVQQGARSLLRAG